MRHVKLEVESFIRHVELEGESFIRQCASEPIITVHVELEVRKFFIRHCTAPRTSEPRTSAELGRCVAIFSCYRRKLMFVLQIC